MIFVNMAILFVSVALAVGIFCRLNKLNWRTHKASVIAFNVGLLGALASVGEHAWTGAMDLQDLCVLIAAASWISVSYKTWQYAAPSYTEKDRG